VERAQQKALALGPEPEAGPDVVQLLLRLPDGSRLKRRFARADALSQVLDWVESEPSSYVRPGEFRVVQKWPGHCRELGPAEAEETLSSLGFSRQEALFLQHLGEEAAPEDVPDPPELQGSGAEDRGLGAAAPALTDPGLGGEWAAAEERAHEALDRRLEGREGTPTAAARNEPELGEIRGTELVEVFHRLVALGMRPPEAAIAAKKYAAQLKELGEMGFENWVEAVRLLDRYGGRLLRVANLLSEQAAGAGEATLPAPAALEQADAPASPQQAEPAPALPAQDSGEVGGPLAGDEEKLRELASMGFVDEGWNRALLRKYAGRLERVIEALVSG